MADMDSYCDCMQRRVITQISVGAKKRATLRLPFGNVEFANLDEFGRFWARSRERLSNSLCEVLHVFSCAVPEVRRVGTSRCRMMI